MVDRVCIIDDDDISIYLTSLVLDEAGFTCKISTYSSADEALQDLPLGNASQLPGVILLDLNMPGKSGWDFLDILQPYERQLLGKMHIFILTSSIAASDKARATHYPLVQGFLHKPLSDEGVSLIQEVYRNSSA